MLKTLLLLGHYVPQLAQLIIKQNVKFNLKGIAVSKRSQFSKKNEVKCSTFYSMYSNFLACMQIGNPLLEFNIDFNSRAEFFWSHGLISDSTYEIFTSICNFSQIRRQSASRTLTPVCSGVIRQVLREVSAFVDTYDVTLDVCLPSVLSQAQVLNQLVRLSFFSFKFSSFHALYMHGNSVSPVSCTYLCFPLG